MDNPLLFFWIGTGITFTYFLIRKKVMRAVLGLSLLWLFLISSTPVPQWLVYRLEKQYPVFAFSEKMRTDSTNILILGGGHAIAPGLPAIDQLSLDALGRLSEAIRIYNAGVGMKLVCSGSSATQRTTQAEMLALAAIELGIHPIDTLLSKAPRNTSEEIAAYKARFGTAPFILVTSAVHMPRAMKLCMVNGLAAIPAPTNHLLKDDPMRTRYDFIPSYHKIMLMQRSMHEFLGSLKASVVNE